jgi:hypothetical protein
MSSLRHLTDQQFSDGTTIDGSRLEKALRQIEEWSNNIPSSDLNSRWMQTQMVLSFCPFTADEVARLNALGGGNTGHRLAPFLPVYNSTAPSGNDPTNNAFRLKGNRLYWQDGYADNWINTPIQYAWCATLQTGKEPMIIDGVSMFLENGNTEYTNDFRYDAVTAPGQEQAGYFVRDIQLQITADNPFIPEKQDQNQVLYHRHSFSAAEILQCPTPTGTGFPDINPSGIAAYEDNTKTLALIDRDMGLPIPPATRFRFYLILRADGPNSSAKNKPWGDYPFETTRPTLTLTMLERTLRA